MRKKIYFIGDSYRGGQVANIRSLFETLSPVITSLGVECSPIYSPINSSTDFDDWSKPWISSLKGECDSALKELDLTSSSVIGFEIATIDRQYLNTAQVPWISFEIHPLRFLEDLYFDADTSFNIDYSLLAEPEDYIWLRARYLRTKYKTTCPQVDNRLLIIGQAPGDKTVYFDGAFRNLTHYFEQLDQIAARFDSTDYRPHPYLTDLDADAAVKSRYSAGTCDENNIYKVLASGRYGAVAGISSSVLREAPYFELQSYLLEPRARQFGEPISYRKLVQSREVWLSGLLETKLPRRPSDLVPHIPENHLRRVFASWSYVSDEDESHKALASLDDRIRHQEASLQVIAQSARTFAEQQVAMQPVLSSVRDEIAELRNRQEHTNQQAAELAVYANQIDERAQNLQREQEKLHKELLTAHERERNLLSKQLDERQARIEEYCGELEKAHNSLAAQKAQILESREAEEALKSRISTLQGEFDQSRIAAERHLAEQQARIDELRRILDKLEGRSVGDNALLRRIAVSRAWRAGLLISKVFRADPQIRRLQATLDRRLHSLNGDESMSSPSVLGPSNVLSGSREEFLRRAYQALLGRDPDPDGMGYYMNRLQAGIARSTVITQILKSSEAKLTGVHVAGIRGDALLYKASRIPVLGEVFAGMRLALYPKLSQSTTAIVDSDPPCIPLHVDDLMTLNTADFIRAVYRLMLAREPDDTGFEHYMRVLRRSGRVGVLSDIYFSNEARKAATGFSIRGLQWGRRFGVFSRLLGLRREEKNTTEVNGDSSEVRAQTVSPAAAKRVPQKPTVAELWLDNSEGRNDTASQPKALILSTYPYRTPRHGGQHRVANIAQQLTGAGFAVYPAGVLGSDAYTPEPGFENFPGHDALKKYFDQPFLMEDWAIGEMYSKDERAFRRLTKLIPIKPDIIHVEHPWMMPFAIRFNKEYCDSSAAIIYSSHNVEAPLKYGIVRQYLGEELAKEAERKVQARECEAISAADAIVCVSEHDAEWTRRHTVSPVVVAPNGVNDEATDLAAIREASRITGNFQYALYCASAHPPNISGFLDLIAGGLGAISLRQRIIIVGAAGPHIVNSEPVKKYGFLASSVIAAGEQDAKVLAALIRGAHCMLLPITLGGGTNLKTAEALWAGKHIVATSKAFRGFEQFAHGTGITIADEAPNFKRGIFSAMQSPPLRLPPDEREARSQLLWKNTLAAVAQLDNTQVRMKLGRRSA